MPTSLVGSGIEPVNRQAMISCYFQYLKIGGQRHYPALSATPYDGVKTASNTET
jgi:hypothetical protein